MKAPDGGCGAETLVFLSYFKDMPDPRERGMGMVMHPIPELLLLYLLAEA